MAITVQLRAKLLQILELNSSVAAFDLGSDLEKTSIPNKTVIITTINVAWVEENSVLDLYMLSLRIFIESSSPHCSGPGVI